MKKLHPKSMMESFMMVPWCSDIEFNQVCRCVASTNSSDWRKARDVLLMWKVREDRRLQDMFEITLAILSDLINFEDDVLYEQHKLSTVHTASITIVRFVSFMTEGSLKDKVERATVLQLAQQIGIPEWLVDMRHEIVHSRMPSLQYLRKALLFAKDFTCEKFWSVEENKEEIESGDELRRSIRETLSVDSTVDIVKYREDISQLISTSRRVCMNTLVKEVAIHLVDNISPDHFEESKSEDPIAKLITPSMTVIIVQVIKIGLLDHLVLELADFIQKCSDSQAKKGCGLLMLYLLNKKNCNYEEITEDILQIFLLSEELSPYVTRLAAVLKVDLSAYSEIKKLSESFTTVPDQCGGGENTEETRIYTVDDLYVDQIHKKVEEPGQIPECKHSESNWKRATDIDWSKIPLGQLPDRDSEADVIMSDLDCAPAADILENGFSDSDDLGSRGADVHENMEWKASDIEKFKSKLQPIC